MKPTTADLWAEQDRHEGGRWRLFRAVADTIDVTEVLYPGCYVDIAPSFVFSSVTYVDVDARAKSFFADAEGVRELVADRDGSPVPEIAFIHGDHTTDLALPEASFDLLVSLYAGFISEHCTHHLRVGGSLLVNPSHGDAAMASLDPRYELAGVVVARSGDYTVSDADLDRYLISKKLQTVTVASLHESGRGVGYTTSPCAYIFTRIA